MFDGRSNDSLPLCCTTSSRSGPAAERGCGTAGGTSELRAGSGWVEELHSGLRGRRRQYGLWPFASGFADPARNASFL